MGARRTFVAIGLGAVAGLALTSAAAPQAVGKTVVVGRVMLNPAAPVCYVGESCSKPAPGFRLAFSRGTSVTRVRTDDQGRYRVVVPPGTYRVTTPGHKSIGSGLHPKKIAIPATERTVRNFTYDAGVR
jgi:hypothetical protein